jgi:prevent-host-death family protein
VTISAEGCRVSFGHWVDRAAAGEDVVVTRRGKPMIRLTAVTPAPAPAPETVAVAAPPAPGMMAVGHLLVSTAGEAPV